MYNNSGFIELESHILNTGHEFLDNLCFQYATEKRVSPHALRNHVTIKLGSARNTRDNDECSVISSGIFLSESGLPCLNLTFKCWQGGGQTFTWSSFETTKSFLEERGHSTKELSDKLPTPSLTTPKTGQDASKPVTPPKSTTQSKELSFEQKKALAAKVYTKLHTAGTSLYLQNKGFNNEDLQLLKAIRFGKDESFKNFIAIPLFASFDDYKNCTPCGIQKIFDGDSKKFSKNSHSAGAFFVIGNLENTSKIAICEGVATGLSIHLATKIPTIVGFNAGNLKPVAEKVKAQFIESEIIICADNDQWKASEINPNTGKRKGNTGLLKARAAAAACGGKIVFPVFDGLDCSEKPTDFNDLYKLAGLEEVKMQIEYPLLPVKKLALHNQQVVFIAVGYEAAKAVQRTFDTPINGETLKDKGVLTFVPNFWKLRKAIQRVNEVTENPIVVLGNNDHDEKIWVEKTFRNVSNVYPAFPQFDSEESTLDCKSFRDLTKKLTDQLLSIGVDEQESIQTVKEEIAKQILEVTDCIEEKTFSFEEKFLPSLELDPSIEKYTFILKTHMGSGKTKQIIDFLNARNAKKVIVVSPRTSLIDSDIRRYKENGIELTDYRLYKKGGAVEKLIVCTNSLDKFENVFKELNDCVLVLDEVEQIFSQLATMTNNNNDLKDSYHFLEKLIRHCQIVIASDAFCSKLSINRIKKLRKNIPTTKIESTYKPLVGQKFFIHESKNSLHALMKQTLLHHDMLDRLGTSNRTAFISNTCSDVEEFSILAKNNGRTVLELTRRTRGDEEQKRFFEDPNKRIEKYNCITFSPVVTSGISIDTAKFDCCFAIFASYAGGTPEDALQMLGRIRTPPKELHVYVDNRKCNKPETFEGVLAEKKVLLSSECIKTNQFINTRDAIDSFSYLQVEVEAKNNRLTNDFLGNFVNSLKELGAEVIQIANEDISDEVKESRRFCREVKNDNRVQAIKNAPDLTRMEAEMIKSEYAPSPEKIHAVEKHEIKGFYKTQEVTEELIIEDNGGHFRKQVRIAEKVVFPELAMKEDVDNLNGISEGKRGIRRAMAWMMRSEIYSEMIKFAGYSVIDDQFVHDGRILNSHNLLQRGFLDWVILREKEIALIHKIPELKNNNREIKEMRQRNFLSEKPMQFLQTFLSDLGLSLKSSPKVIDKKKVYNYTVNKVKLSRLNEILRARNSTKNRIEPHENRCNERITSPKNTVYFNDEGYPPLNGCVLHDRGGSENYQKSCRGA